MMYSATHSSAKLISIFRARRLPLFSLSLCVAIAAGCSPVFSQDAPAPARRLPAGATPVTPSVNSSVKPAPAAPTVPAAAAAAATTGRAKPAAASKAKPQSTPGASQGASAAEDREIEATIRAKLAKSKVGKDGFTVRVQGGVAYWDGQTNVVQHKGAATRMARTAGARQVVNRITISEAARQQAAANLEQGRRRAQVKRSEQRSE